jgi:hypothetical protein
MRSWKPCATPYECWTKRILSGLRARNAVRLTLSVAAIVSGGRYSVFRRSSASEMWPKNEENSKEKQKSDAKCAERRNTCLLFLQHATRRACGLKRVNDRYEFIVLFLLFVIIEHKDTVPAFSPPHLPPHHVALTPLSDPTRIHTIRTPRVTFVCRK